jgi:class 3 adenylate cyclase
LLRGYWNDTQDDLDVIDRALSKLLGQDAQAPQPSEQTRARSGGLVTILFTDVEGSTALTQRLGDVRAREVFREHERITRDALRDHGGSEVKTMGDGFMASFPSASAAIESAVAMQRAFARRNEASDTPISVRIGLNAGEPIAEEEDLFGTAVITAARIAAQAAGGEILASNVVRELVAGRGFMFSDRGETVLRGFEDPVRVYEVRWRGEG